MEPGTPELTAASQSPARSSHGVRVRISVAVSIIQAFLFLVHLALYATWTFFWGVQDSSRVAELRIALAILSVSFVAASLLAHQYFTCKLHGRLGLTRFPWLSAVFLRRARAGFCMACRSCLECMLKSTRSQPQTPRGSFAEPELPDFAKWGKTERVSMRGVRRKTAEHLRQAWNTIPHVTQQDRADITELEQLRARFAPRAEEAGGKMTVTAIALKVCASALKVFPQFNASIDMGKEEIIYKQYINIGVAVDTDRGLLVPVIRDVDKKNIVELAAEMTQLSKKARDRKLTPEEMEGGTFTITNLGGIGGTGFSPIVNHPEVAILGLSRSRMEPEWVNNKFEPRLILPLSLSYDHRLIDGADAARFLRWIAEAFEQPFLLSVQG